MSRKHLRFTRQKNKELTKKTNCNTYASSNQMFFLKTIGIKKRHQMFPVHIAQSQYSNVCESDVIRYKPLTLHL